METTYNKTFMTLQKEVKEATKGVGKMALATLAEELSQCPPTWRLTNTSNSTSRLSGTLFWLLQTLVIHVVYKHTFGSSHIHINEN